MLGGAGSEAARRTWNAWTTEPIPGCFWALAQKPLPLDGPENILEPDWNELAPQSQPGKADVSTEVAALLARIAKEGKEVPNPEPIDYDDPQGPSMQSAGEMDRQGVIRINLAALSKKNSDLCYRCGHESFCGGICDVGMKCVLRNLRKRLLSEMRSEPCTHELIKEHMGNQFEELFRQICIDFYLSKIGQEGGFSVELTEQIVIIFETLLDTHSPLDKKDTVEKLLITGCKLRRSKRANRRSSDAGAGLGADPDSRKRRPPFDGFKLKDLTPLSNNAAFDRFSGALRMIGEDMFDTGKLRGQKLLCKQQNFNHLLNAYF